MPLLNTYGAASARGFGLNSVSVIGVPVVTDLGTGTGTNSAVVTLTSPVPAGSLIFLFGAFSANSVTDVNITSSVSQTWNKNVTFNLPGVTGTDARMYGAYSFNSAAMSIGSTITATGVGAAFGNGLITACVITNMLTTSAVYDSAVANVSLADHDSGSAAITAAGATTQANELVIYGLVSYAYYANATSFTQTATWSAPPSSVNTGSTGILIGGGYKVVPTSSTVSVTNTTNVQNPYGMVIYGFKHA